MIKKILIFYLIFVEFLFSKEVGTKIQEIKIEANEIKISRSKNNILFTGKVIVKDKDVKFMADKMNVKYVEKNKKNFDIYYIKAENNVEIKTINIYANSEKGDYNLNTNIIVLEKNVVLNDGASIIYGNKLIYNVDNETVEMFGDKKKEQEQVYIILEDIDKVKENYGKKK